MSSTFSGGHFNRGRLTNRSGACACTIIPPPQLVLSSSLCCAPRSSRFCVNVTYLHAFKLVSVPTHLFCTRCYCSRVAYAAVVGVLTAARCSTNTYQHGSYPYNCHHCVCTDIGSSCGHFLTSSVGTQHATSRS